MEVAPGVVVKEGDRVRRGPKQVQTTNVTSSAILELINDETCTLIVLRPLFSEEMVENVEMEQNIAKNDIL